MADLSAVVIRLAILFFIIAVGFVAAKCKIFPENTNKVLAQLVLNITTPCMVLYSVLGSTRQISNSEVLLLTGVAVGCFAVVIALAQVLPGLLRCPRDKIGMYRFMVVFANMGFLGFPVVQAMFGSNAVFYAAVFNLVFQVILYTYGVKLVSAPGQQRFSLEQLLSPVLLASVAAYVFYVVDLRVPQPVVDALELLQNVTSPVCMLVIGISLAAVPLKGVFGNWRLYAISAVRLLALPIATYYLLRPVMTNPILLGVTIVLTGMPIATMTTLLAVKYGGDEKLAASGVFLSTAMSAVTIPFVMWLLFAG